MCRCSKVLVLLTVSVLTLAFCSPASAQKGDDRIDLPDTRILTEVLPPPHNTCDGAIDVGSGGSWMDSTNTATNDYDPGAGGCTGFYAQGPDVVYKVVLGPEERVIARMSPLDTDVAVYLITDCDDPVGSCVAGADNSGLGSETVTYCSENGGTYYIICDGFCSGCYGRFILNVTVEGCYEHLCCPAYNVVYDFNEETAFTTELCDATGVGDVWRWDYGGGGPELDCDLQAVTKVLRTNQGWYVDNAADRAIVGPVDVTDETWCMELCHFYRTQYGYDGGNVNISTDGGATWTLIYPLADYPGTCDGSTRCVGSEGVFTGFSYDYVRDCFDLDDYIGQSLHFGFDFGSDAAGNYQGGWFIKWLKFGTVPSAVEPTSWGTIKGMFR